MSNIFSNTVFFEKLNDFIHNYKKVLKLNSSLSYKNCKNGKVNILNKINTIEIIDCNKIDIYINKLIGNLIVTNSKNINIFIDTSHSLKTIDLTNSNIKPLNI